MTVSKCIVDNRQYSEQQKKNEDNKMVIWNRKLKDRQYKGHKINRTNNGKNKYTENKRLSKTNPTKTLPVPLVYHEVSSNLSPIHNILIEGKLLLKSTFVTIIVEYKQTNFLYFLHSTIVVLPLFESFHLQTCSESLILDLRCLLESWRSVHVWKALARPHHFTKRGSLGT